MPNFAFQNLFPLVHMYELLLNRTCHIWKDEFIKVEGVNAISGTNFRIRYKNKNQLCLIIQIWDLAWVYIPPTLHSDIDFCKNPYL